MFAIKYVIMFEHTNIQMFKCTFEQNSVITNVRNIVTNNTITFVINKYRKRILFTLSFLVSSCLKRRSFLQNMRELPGGFELVRCRTSSRSSFRDRFSGSIAQLLTRCFHILFFISTFVYARCDFVPTKSNLRQPSCRRYSLRSHTLC